MFINHMVKLKFWVILLFIVAFILSITSLFLSMWTYSLNSDSKISTHFSSEASIGLSVEGSGASCGDSLCNGVETCSTCSVDCGACPAGGGGGGGGGGSRSTAPNFKLDKDSFNIKIVSGDTETNKIIVSNIGDVSIDINVSVTGIGDYVSFSTDLIHLAKGKTAPLEFIVHAPEPGLYPGKIIFTYQGITKEVLVILNVISEGVLFDTSITLPELYRVIGLGQRLPALIEIIEIGGETGVDTTINYLIKDFEGKTRFIETETFYVFGIKRFNKIFYTNGLEQGDYVLGIEVIYPGGFATSSTPFRISTSENLLKTWIIFGIFFASVLFIILLIIFVRRHDEDNDYKSKESLN